MIRHRIKVTVKQRRRYAQTDAVSVTQRVRRGLSLKRFAGADEHHGVFAFAVRA